jgi:hypothetical protein
VPCIAHHQLEVVVVVYGGAQVGVVVGELERGRVGRRVGGLEGVRGGKRGLEGVRGYEGVRGG